MCAVLSIGGPNALCDTTPPQASPSAHTAVMILSNTNAAVTAAARGCTQWAEV